MLYIIAIYIAAMVILPSHTLAYRWLMSIIVGLDCFANAFFLLGDYRETISGRLGKAYKAQVVWVKPFYHAINASFYVFEWNMGHCNRSIDHLVGSKTIWRWH